MTFEELLPEGKTVDQLTEEEIKEISKKLSLPELKRLEYALRKSLRKKQTRIKKVKREKAEEAVEELLAKGFKA